MRALSGPLFILPWVLVRTLVFSLGFARLTRSLVGTHISLGAIAPPSESFGRTLVYTPLGLVWALVYTPLGVHFLLDGAWRRPVRDLSGPGFILPRVPVRTLVFSLGSALLIRSLC